NNGAPILAVTFSPDCEFAVTAGSDRIVRLWEVKTGLLKKVFEGHAAGVNVVSFSPDNSAIITGSDDRTARLWDLNSGRQAGPALVHKDLVFAVAFSRDGRLAYSADKTGE